LQRNDGLPVMVPTSLPDSQASLDLMSQDLSQGLIASFDEDITILDP